MSIQAIETKYAGYRFRSRLEARWAVFLDALKIPWEYEKEGYSFAPWKSLLDETKATGEPFSFIPAIGFVGWVETKSVEGDSTSSIPEYVPYFQMSDPRVPSRLRSI